MNLNHNDTEKLWRLLISLVSLMVMLMLAGLTYLVLGDQIRDYLNRPKYTQEQLDEMSKRREIMVRKERNDDWDLVEDGIHVRTGLKADDDLQLIISTCTSCHSGKLITQNRATRDGWKSMIVWMQETQGLMDLGAQEPKVLDYLEKHYAPEEVGRRRNLNVDEIEWYTLDVGGG